MFTSLGIPTYSLRFVEGSSYQLTKEYNMDNYRLCATVSEHDAKKAAAAAAIWASIRQTSLLSMPASPMTCSTRRAGLCTTICATCAVAMYPVL